MALDRFSNKQEIIDKDGKSIGLVWKDADIDLLKLDVKEITPIDTPVVEIHLYAKGPKGQYITGGTIEDFEYHNGRVLINHAAAAQQFGIERGDFEIVVNVHKDLLGSEGQNILYIKDISDDRRELHIKAVPESDIDVATYVESIGDGSSTTPIYETQIDGTGNEVQVFDEDGAPIIKAFETVPISQDIALNFGENHVYKIINQKEWDEENDFVVRLYEPLPDSISIESAFVWVVEQLSDSYIDNVNVLGPEAAPINKTQLKGPNFDIDTTYSTVTETNFRNWNQLLDANLSTSQNIIDQMFSGSLTGVPLGIDYSSFDNFVHFSSATERVENFKYKLELVEYYDKRLSVLDTAVGSDSSSLQGNIAVTQRRKDQVVGSFDGFERWAYNEPTASLFTHGISGSFVGAQGYTIESYPKFLSGSRVHLHHSTSSYGESWLTGLAATASLYDIHNEKGLHKTIPEHIRRDPNNDQFELFVNMIGHHYDIIYSYIDNLTRIYKPEEHPKIGQSKDVLFDVAQSLGWTLTNGKQASQLWQYKLGVNSGSGQYQTTGSLFSKSDEAITTEVWRRIVNNLPYLLKIKGTTRSVKALMNTYGIPQTLLSIREYGGPKVKGDQPLLIEDRFTYALNFNSGSEIIIPNSWYSSSLSTTQGPWGGDLYNNNFQTILPTYTNTPAKTHQVRFRPSTTASMYIMSNMESTFSTPIGAYAGNERTPLWSIAIQHTGSYSGSGKWGRVHLSYGMHTVEGHATASMTDWLPLYDGNFWNLSVGFTSAQFDGTAGGIDSFNTVDSTAVTYRVHVQQASDYISDKIVHSGSLEISPSTLKHRLSWAQAVGLGNVGGNIATGEGERIMSQSISLGGNTGSKEDYGDRWGVIAALSESFLATNSSSNTLSFGDKPDVINGTHANVNFSLGSFTGSMQEWRSWMEYYTDDTLDLRTKNPTSYVSALGPSSSYDTLIRHYPLGTDLNAVDHSTGTGLILSSSHPANHVKDFSAAGNANTFATMSGFTTPANVQRGNYTPVEETYYVQGVSLGSNLPRSQKIRLEDNELIRMLSPKTTGERSRFDRAPLDTNRLGLFYSHADQVNKEIFNHIGDVELDDFIGDPDDEFEFIYDDLHDFAKGYWKKYSDRNDVNAFMRIFGQFDFALFRQIKQLIPERVDEAMGLIVEPNILERNKYKLTKRIGNEPLHYSSNITPDWYSASADILQLSGTIDKPVSIGMEQIYNISASGYTEIPGNLFFHIGQMIPSGGSDYCNIEINTFDGLDTDGAGGPLLKARATASLLNVYQVRRTSGESTSVLIPVWSGSFGHAGSGDAPLGIISPLGGNVNFFNSGSENMVGGMVSSTTDVSTNGLRIQFDTYNRYDTIRDFDVDIVHSETTANLDLTLSARLILTKDNEHAEKIEYFHTDYAEGVHIISSSRGDGVTYDDNGGFSNALLERELASTSQTIPFAAAAANEWIYNRLTFNDLLVPARTNLTLELVYHSSGTTRSPRIDRLDIIQSIKKVCHSVHMLQVLDCRKSDIFKKVIDHYDTGSASGKIAKNKFRAVSQSLGLVYSQSLTEADYMDDFFAMTENQRYVGSKLGGPGINQQSGIYAIDNKPVIEVYSVNPNQLIYTDRPSQGNPGNLIVR